jgi:hypothetical protein
MLADRYRFTDRIQNNGCAVIWNGPHDAQERYEEMNGAGPTMAQLGSGKSYSPDRGASCTCASRRLR